MNPLLTSEPRVKQKISCLQNTRKTNPLLGLKGIYTFLVQLILVLGKGKKTDSTASQGSWRVSILFLQTELCFLPPSHRLLAMLGLQEREPRLSTLSDI